jgi:hypothetical protein
MNILSPAYLFIGPESATLDHAKLWIQKQLCKTQGCMACSTCRHIEQQQHHATLWLTPEKQYTLDQLAVIFKTISFALETSEQFFIIITKADFLTNACANSLLKSLEEPPSGYHFILLANRLDAILPTIRSRCIMTPVSSNASTGRHCLFPFFATSKAHDPLAFLQELETSGINERDSLELLDQLLVHWIESYKASLINKEKKITEHAQSIISILSTAMQQPPMPGSSKLFWKDLFLQIKG